jgi:hypothetical protein
MIFTIFFTKNTKVKSGDFDFKNQPFMPKNDGNVGFKKKTLFAENR